MTAERVFALVVAILDALLPTLTKHQQDGVLDRLSMWATRRKETIEKHQAALDRRKK
jgi:hypothetical protein